MIVCVRYCLKLGYMYYILFYLLITARLKKTWTFSLRRIKGNNKTILRLSIFFLAFFLRVDTPFHIITYFFYKFKQPSNCYSDSSHFWMCGARFCRSLRHTKTKFLNSYVKVLDTVDKECGRSRECGTECRLARHSVRLLQNWFPTIINSTKVLFSTATLGTRPVKSAGVWLQLNSKFARTPANCIRHKLQLITTSI